MNRERRRAKKVVSNAPIVVAGIALLGVMVIGGAFVHTANPDASATFTTFIGLVISQGVVAVATLSKLRDVEKQTNGRLHAKDEELTAKDRALRDAGIDPLSVTASNPTVD